MEQQLTETSEKLKQLEVDNSKITQRNSTLEKVLVFREGEIAELQDQHKVDVATTSRMRPEVCRSADCKSRLQKRVPRFLKMY